MAKAVVWIGMLVVFFGSIIWGMQVLNADHGELYGYAVGKPDSSNVCELQVVISPLMTLDGPTQTISPTSMTPDWDHWLGQHFKLLEVGTGNAVDMRKGGFKSADISESQAGAADFIALADIEAGKQYTLEFQPVLGEPEKYIATIDGAEKEFRRTTFEANY